MYSANLRQVLEPLHEGIIVICLALLSGQKLQEEDHTKEEEEKELFKAHKAVLKGPAQIWHRIQQWCTGDKALVDSNKLPTLPSGLMPHAHCTPEVRQ